MEVGACFKKLILRHPSVACVKFCYSVHLVLKNMLTVSGYVGNDLSYRDLFVGYGNGEERKIGEESLSMELFHELFQF